MHVPGSPLRRLLALAVVALAAAALGAPSVGATTHRGATSARPRDTAAPLPYENPTLPVAQRVQDLLSRMTLA
jgi:beta-glucosidase